LVLGGLRTFRICSQDVVALRTAKGATVTDAYCPHLGAHLGVDPGQGLWTNGSTPHPRVHLDTSCLECPFHGLEFDAGSGQCTSARNCAASASPPRNAFLKLWKVTEVAGAIFVWFGEGEPTWSIADVLSPLSPATEARSVRMVGKTEQWVQCALQEIPENGADVLHLGYLHRPSDIFPVFVQHGFTGGWNRRARDDSQWFQADLQVETWCIVCGIDVGWTKVRTEVRQIGPGIVYLQYRCSPKLVLPGVSGATLHVLQTVKPVEHNLHCLQHVAYAEPGLPTALGKALLYFTVKQVDRDIDIWQTKKLELRPVLMRAERPIAEFRRWFRQFSPPGLAQVQVELDEKSD